MTLDRRDLKINVRLTPKAARNAIKGWAADAAGNRYLKAGVTAAPEKGRANQALIALLAGEWDIPKNSIAIVRGETDRNKTLLLLGISAAAAQKILQ
jgi:uncharacterized protein YggU (UPF0235/DUF167 family)